MGAGTGGAVTVRVAEVVLEPPAPVQVTLWVKLPTLLAETLNEPLAPPLPTLQLVAWVEDQLKVWLPVFCSLEDGLQEAETVGTCGGAVTVRVAEALPTETSSGEPLLKSTMKQSTVFV